MIQRARDLKELVDTAYGRIPPDILLEGGRLVNVYTGEVLEGVDVAIKGKYVARVGKKLRSFTGRKTRIINVKGKYVLPGFIDAHAHIIPYVLPSEFMKEALKRGVTTIVTELLDLSFKVDLDGLITYVESTKGFPVKVFFTAPPYITLSEGLKKRIPKRKDLLRLLKRDDVLGLGESFWQEIFRDFERFSSLRRYVLKERKTLEGHGAGAKEEKLQAYLATGISSCHEPISLEEVVERLRLGIYAMVRDGSVRSDLGAISGISGMGIDTRRLILVSDFISPDDIEKKGYLDGIVSRAIELGIEPIDAIRMVTLNPATHFGIDNIVGGIAPSRYADIVIVSDLREPRPEIVLSNGEVFFEDGRLNFTGGDERPKLSGLKRRKISEDDLRIKALRKGKVRIRVIDQVTELVTKESIEEVSTGSRDLKLKDNLARVSLVTEYSLTNCVIRNTGIREGAFATSSLWECAGVAVIGIERSDMCIAVNRIFEIGGGMVVVKNGKILEELPLPLGSMISTLSFKEVSDKIQSINTLAQSLGIKFQKPILLLETLTTPAIPFLRISDSGLVDLKSGRIVGLFVD